jgi:hypothetical protein
MVKLGTIPLGQGFTTTIPLHYTDRDLVVDRLEVIEVPGDAEVQSKYVSARITRMGEIAATQGEETLYKGEVEVSVAPETPWGLIYATRLVMHVTARPMPEESPASKEYSAFLMGEVYGSIRSSDSIISLGMLSARQEFAHNVTLERPDGRPFMVEGARVVETSMPGVKARVEPISLTAHRLVVYGNTGAFRGSAKGIVEVMTNVPGEEKLQLRFAGQVR